jgi:hypothetical protein
LLVFGVFSEHAPIVLNFFCSVNPFSYTFFSGLI